jgi:DNA-binding NtrC family response regulator
LNVVPIHVPPLRERPEDVAPLIDFFLQKHSALHPEGPMQVEKEFIDALRRLDLTGNAREVENLVRQALVYSDSPGALQLSCLPPEVLSGLSAEVASVTQPVCPASDSLGAKISTEALPLVTVLSSLLDRHGGDLSHSMEDCERLFLEVALRRARGNQSRAARLLGITPRSVYNKLRKLQSPAATPECPKNGQGGVVEKPKPGK